MATFRDWLKNYLGVSSMDEKIQKEVKKSLVEKELNFTSYYQADLKKYRELENLIWFRGEVSELETFYKEKIHPMNRINTYFYRLVSGDMKRVHCPMASAISRSMSSILFGDDIKLEVDAGSESPTEEINDRLKTIFKANDIRELLLKGAMLESYSGAVAAKIILDTEFSDHPIIQLYPAEQLHVESKYGKVYEVTFKDSYTFNGLQYTLHSVYGKGYIKYKLMNKDGNEVSLETIPSLAELKDIVLVDSEGNPIKDILCVYKVNRPVNAEFMTYNENMGASDYDGLAGLFNELDSVLSTYMEYFVNGGRVLTFISEDQMKRDSMGRIVRPDTYGLNVIPMFDNTVNPDNKTEVKRDYPVLNVQPFKEAFKDLINMCLMRVGLSPVSFSLDGVSGMVSRESLESREKTTTKTRQDKIKLWEEFLARMMKLLLIYDDIKAIVPANGDNVSVYKLDYDYSDIKYLPTFPQFNIPTREEQVNLIVAAVAGKVIDVEHAVRSLYEDEMSEDEMMKMVTNIKLENMLPDSFTQQATVKAVDPSQITPLEQMESEEAMAAEETVEEEDEQNAEEI
jgi:hypothetical protein